MATRRIVHEYRGSGWIHDIELAAVVVESWVDDGDGATQGTSGWGGYGIVAGNSDGTGNGETGVPGPEPGSWTLRLNNGRSGTVHVSELAGPGQHVRFDGLGESPLET